MRGLDDGRISARALLCNRILRTAPRLNVGGLGVRIYWSCHELRYEVRDA